MDPRRILRAQRLRDRELSDEELEYWIRSHVEGTVPDYQMAAWLMAVCLNGMSMRETATLTRCLVGSGKRIDWNEYDTADAVTSQCRRPLVDKHSTGGVGDKVSIMLAPLVACFGVWVPMLAGRGLAHTGGTIDKLECLPGYRVDLSIDEFKTIVRQIGCSIAATGPDICPADQKLYALRDVTDTVVGLPLKVSSIMSKKIAENADSLVVDVTYGRAAFQENLEEAQILAASLVSTGEAYGLKPTTAFLTRMDQPRGQAVGNYLEVRECMEIMTGQGIDLDARKDLITLVVVQAAQMILQSGLHAGRSLEMLCCDAYQALVDGRAWNKFRDMVVAHGGHAPSMDPGQWDLLCQAKLSAHVTSQQNGFVVDIDALEVGQIAVRLGAGRVVAEDVVDPSAGIWFHFQVGGAVTQGDVLATIYSSGKQERVDEAVHRLQAAIYIAPEPPPKVPIISHVVSSIGSLQPFSVPSFRSHEQFNP